MSAGITKTLRASPATLAPSAAAFSKNGVIHGNVFQLGIDFLQLRFVAAFADMPGKRLDRLMRFRKKFAQRIQKRRHAPEKHSGIPLIHSGRHILLGDRKLRLFREAANGINGEASAAKWLLHAFDIAESGLRPCRWNSQHHHATFCARHVQRRADNFPVTLRLRDVMIGGQNRHHRIALGRMANVNGRKRNGRRCVSSARFRQNFLARSRRQLLAKSGGLFGVCH